MTNKTIIIAALLATAASLNSHGAEAASRYRGWHRHTNAAQLAFRGEHRYRGHHAGGRLARYALRPAPQAARAIGGVQEGRASFYSGGRTASGGSVGAATCAHRSLPFGTKLLVTNLNNARQTIVTVTDRGPFVRGRVLDVSRGAAGILGMLHAGVSQIRMQVLGRAG